MNRSESRKTWGLVLMILLWIAAAWFLYPLLVLDSVDMTNAKSYLYRSAFGLVILLVFFGKTVFDLLYPQYVSGRSTGANTILLVLYALVLAGGIIFMFIRWVLLLLESRKTGFIF